MRPLLLQLDHFGSFREPVSVDFSDTEYFALVGPTGAGKSTIIDAICFALYGTVPRWGKENVIAHALAPSVSSGKVALVFDSGGRRYGVVRAMVRDSKGAVRTKEARIDELDPSAPLEQAYEAVVRPLAEGENVTPEAQRVTGLEYRFFTQCVVLPQGRFAEFLHAAPRERQDLLVQLLDADVYELIRQRAVQEEEQAKRDAAFARDQLGELSGATAEAERELADRLAALRGLGETIGADLDLLRAREAGIRRAEQERAAVAERRSVLASLRMPEAVPTLASARRAAAESVETLAAEVATLEADEHEAYEALAALGDRGAPREALAALDARERHAAQAARARAEAVAAAEPLPGLAAEREAAEQALAAAEAQRERLRDAHAAAHLAPRLAVGEPCPVCRQSVAELPRHEPPADMRTADRALAGARDRAERARSAHARAEASASMLAGQADRLEAELAALPEPGDRAGLEGRLAAIAKAEEIAGQARTAFRAARGRLDRARTETERIERQAESAWRTLESARDRLLVSGGHDDPPPPLTRDDLHRAWTDLLAWRDRAGQAARTALAACDEQLAQAGETLARDRRRLGERLAEHGVVPPRDASPDQLGAAVAGAAARVESALDRVRDDRRRAADLDAQVTRKEHEAKVAHELALRLRANAFERWLCAEALAVLVASASETLRELSDGQYELTLSDRTGDIEVVDHGEAGMRRSARTLSGGETFQAALALALALSGAVAKGLDSIFLDEGFGTLDPATLDTVATTLERLAAGQDRMIGVVTHVPALAERVPVRFEVRRDAKGSHVRKAAT
ncbi:SMC family ATPase [Nonomuraea sp. KC401]|uniref:AAA family ATPase n=1 Tax=unclassified Nonomuraea TaxID=2593643 RepID=UPI0010FD2C89|nr:MULTISPECIES: SMC family ATPase [unclassified Nonomuraea]NBE94069.1 AAA family ATPase [Nonomuraea sp. K271]TLF65133.1 SMC family ATPase [Nonomuraea sp. KC401]